MDSFEVLSPVQAVRRACAKAFKIDEAQLLSRSRVRWLSVPRQATCYVLRHRFSHLSYPAIARLVRRSDHSTIIHACRQTEARMARDAALAAKITALIVLPVDARAHDAHVTAWAMARLHQPPAAAPSDAPIFDDDELAEFIDPARVFCGQCDRSLLPAEAARCGSRLCGLRPRAAA
jgi:hypothetical protein